MIEVMPNLFVGNADDYELQVKGRPDWAVVQACKEPYHRRALGYSGRAAPKNHPEYLVARRGNCLILNMIDADTPRYIPKEIIDEALAFVRAQLNNETKVLIHCNQGMSRSPSLAMLYMGCVGELPQDSFLSAENEFRKVYKDYAPANGIRKFIEFNWMEYMNSSK